MNDDRTLILGRIRAALADVPADETADDVPVPRGYRRAGPVMAGHALELFAERAADYRAQVQRVARHAVPEAIASLLAAQGISAYVVPPGFPEHYLTECGAAAAPVRDEERLTARSLDALQGVITTCALAIAETGTIVLDGGPGQGRRALSLLPDYHLCLVHADQIVATVPDAIARLNPRAPLTMISGPSATSDIENTRVEGVHGPRTLHILIVESDEKRD